MNKRKIFNNIKSQHKSDNKTGANARLIWVDKVLAPRGNCNYTDATIDDNAETHLSQYNLDFFSKENRQNMEAFKAENSNSGSGN